MNRFARTSVVFVDGKEVEFDKVELLDSGVLKALQKATATTPLVPADCTPYKVSYFSPQVWAGIHPAETVAVPDDPSKAVPPPGL